MPESKTQVTAKALVIKNKLLFIFCMLFIMISLFLVCYLFFFRAVSIDVTKNVQITYTGESGGATASIESNEYNMNQRIQEFLDSLDCRVSPKENLSNGSVLNIQCGFSEELANKYNIKVINEQKEVVVEGLAERYVQSSDIPTDFLDTLDHRAQSYLERNIEVITKENFNQFYITSNTQIKEKNRIHRVFLKSMNIENKDKIVDIYEITALGKINQGVGKEDLVDQEMKIFYLISYDNINSSQKLANEDISGSRLQSDLKDLKSLENIETALRMKYLLNYAITIIE